jgi:hypothetical protein
MPRSPVPKKPEPALYKSENLPVHTIRHRSIKAAIWRNQTEKGLMYTVTVSRSYKVGEEWKESHSFTYDQIMNVAKVLSDAHSFITGLRAKDREDLPAGSPRPNNRPQ